MVVLPFHVHTSDVPSFAIFHIHVVSFPVADIDLTWAADARRLRLSHFLPMGNPAGQTTDGKHDRKHIRRDPYQLVNDAAVKIYVRIKFPTDEKLVLQS